MSKTLHACSTYRIDYGYQLQSCYLDAAVEAIRNLPSGFYEDVGDEGAFNLECDRADLVDYISELEEESEIRLALIRLMHSCDDGNDTLHFHYF